MYRNLGTMIIFIILTLNFCLCLPIMKLASGRSFLLWRYSPKSPSNIALQVIEDISGDGHQDIFIASSSIISYSNNRVQELPAELIFIDGKNGSLIRSLNLGMVSVNFAAVVGKRIIVSQTNMLRVYDLNFRKLYNKSLSKTPRLLRILSNSQLIYTIDNEVCLLNLENGEKIWTWYAPDSITGVLIIGRQIICAYPNYLAMLNLDGVLLHCEYVPRLNLSYAIYSESLHRLDDEHFLYLEDVWSLFEKSPNPSLSMWEVKGNSFSMKWKIEIGGGAANKPLIIPDLDGDNMNDFICVGKEDYKISVFSGQTGNLIYSTDLTGLYVHAACLIDDINNDEIREIAINPYDKDNWHSLYICSLRRNMSISQAISLNLYKRLVPIEDVDGDGFSDFIGAKMNGEVECYRGFSSEIIPEFSYFSPIMLSLMLIINVILIFAMSRYKKP